MKIRTKISLWIIGAGICASLVLSSVVFYGLVREYYEVIDNDLEAVFTDIVGLSAGAADVDAFINALDGFPGIGRYWVSLYSADRDIIWQTPVAKKISIPIADTPAPFTFSTHLRSGDVYPDMRGEKLLTFRVKLRFFQVSGKSYGVLIGKPIETSGLTPADREQLIKKVRVAIEENLKREEIAERLADLEAARSDGK